MLEFSCWVCEDEGRVYPNLVVCPDPDEGQPEPCPYCTPWGEEYAKALAACEEAFRAFADAYEAAP